MPLTINIPAREFLDEETSRIITVKETKLVMEHSLLSVSKWEAKYKKPFLVEKALDSTEKILYYFECMTITPQNPDPYIYLCLSNEDIDKIMKYINDPMTATWFSDKETKNSKKGLKPKKEILTSEVIYWEMIQLQIPIEFQKWHLNRLTTLIRVCNAKNNPEKMSKKDILAQNAALNKARRAKMHSKG